MKEPNRTSRVQKQSPACTFCVQNTKNSKSGRKGTEKEELKPRKICVWGKHQSRGTLGKAQGVKNKEINISAKGLVQKRCSTTSSLRRKKVGVKKGT